MLAATDAKGAGFGALERLFGTIEKLVRPPVVAPSPVDWRPEPTNGGVAFADRLLESLSLGDLDEALDASLDERAGVTAGPEAGPKEVASTRDTIARLASRAPASFPAIIGPGPTAIFLEGVTGLIVLLSFLETALKASGAPPVAPSSTVLRADRDRLEFLYSTDLPLVVREGAWHLLRGIVAMIAISRATELARPLESWRAHALATTFRDGIQRFITSVTQSIQTQELPYVFRKETLDEWLKQASARDDLVHHPLGDGESG